VTIQGRNATLQARSEEELQARRSTNGTEL
jgi:hypothetical protein